MSWIDSTDAEAIRDPKWDDAERVHDWRNHIGDDTRAIWHTLTDAQRLALAADAEEASSNEEWD